MRRNFDVLKFSPCYRRTESSISTYRHIDSLHTEFQVEFNKEFNHRSLSAVYKTLLRHSNLQCTAVML